MRRWNDAGDLAFVGVGLTVRRWHRATLAHAPAAVCGGSFTPPWRQHSWALPGLSVPAPTPAVSHRLGLRHNTVPQRARQRRQRGRRWWPTVKRTLIGDQTERVQELGIVWARRGIRVIAPRGLAAALYAPAPPPWPGTHGWTRVKGERLPPRGADDRGVPDGLDVPSSRCGGCSCAIPRASMISGRTARPASVISHVKSCKHSSNV